MATLVRNEEGFARFATWLDDAGQREDVRGTCVRYAVTLRELYLDARGASITAARVEVWWRLSTAFLKSPGEIARIFDRDTSSVTFVLAALERHAAEMKITLGPETVAQVAAGFAKLGSKKMSARMRAKKEG